MNQVKLHFENARARILLRDKNRIKKELGVKVFSWEKYFIHLYNQSKGGSR